jgi:RanGTP-binding protein.
MQCANHRACSEYVFFSATGEVSADQFPQNVKSEDRDELVSLQQRLESKIQVIAPAIDMIELM